MTEASGVFTRRGQESASFGVDLEGECRAVTIGPICAQKRGDDEGRIVIAG